MTEDQLVSLRIEAMRLAVSILEIHDAIDPVSMAEDIYKFLSKGEVNEQRSSI